MWNGKLGTGGQVEELGGLAGWVVGEGTAGW